MYTGEKLKQGIVFLFSHCITRPFKDHNHDDDEEGEEDCDYDDTVVVPSSFTSIHVRFGPIHLGVSASFGTPTIPSENINSSTTCILVQSYYGALFLHFRLFDKVDAHLSQQRWADNCSSV